MSDTHLPSNLDPYTNRHGYTDLHCAYDAFRISYERGFWEFLVIPQMDALLSYDRQDIKNKWETSSNFFVF